MPNQYNFRNEVVNRTEPRFLASRIVRLPSDTILFEEIPASFGYDNEDNIELHFYTAIGNVLSLSTFVKLSEEIVKLHIVGYDDGTYKTYLQIDFTKLFVDKSLTLPNGDYRISINFFSDEIGSYDSRVLTISEISPSRTEVEVYFNNINDITEETNKQLIREFVLPSFTKTDAIGVMKKVIQDGVTSGNDSEGLTANNIIENIDIEGFQTLESTIGRLETLGIDEQFKDALNAYLPNLFEKVREKIVIGDERVQSDELMAFIRADLYKTLDVLRTSVDSRVSLS